MNESSLIIVSYSLFLINYLLQVYFPFCIFSHKISFINQKQEEKLKKNLQMITHTDSYDFNKRPLSLLLDCLQQQNEFEASVQHLENRENYVCMICFQLLWIPMTCFKCCQNVCKGCLDLCSQKSKQCSNPHCEQNNSYKPSEKTTIENLNRLSFFCKNKAIGCNKVIQYKNILEHQDVCQFQSVPCKYEKCRTQVLKINIENHQNMCHYRIVKCDFCPQKIQISLQKTHQQRECLMFIVDCFYCQKGFKRKDLREHEEQCDSHLVDCNQCNQKMPLIKWKNEHTKLVCLELRIKELENKETQLIPVIQETQELSLLQKSDQVLLQKVEKCEQIIDDFRNLANELQNQVGILHQKDYQNEAIIEELKKSNEEYKQKIEKLEGICNILLDDVNTKKLRNLKQSHLN